MEYPISRKHRATVLSLTAWPCLVSSSAIAWVDLLVHRNALIGSPAVVSAKILPNCSCIPGVSFFHLFPSAPRLPDPPFPCFRKLSLTPQLRHRPGDRCPRHPSQLR